MTTNLQMIVLLTAIMAINLGHADPVSSKSAAANELMSDQNALKQTQDLLRNKQQREDSSKDNSKAQQSLQKIDSVAGSPEISDKIFGLSAEVMNIVFEQSSGDPEKMKVLLQNYEQNPKEFYEKMSLEQKNKLRGIASEIEKNGTSTSPH